MIIGKILREHQLHFTRPQKRIAFLNDKGLLRIAYLQRLRRAKIEIRKIRKARAESRSKRRLGKAAGGQYPERRVFFGQAHMNFAYKIGAGAAPEHGKAYGLNAGLIEGGSEPCGDSLV